MIPQEGLGHASPAKAAGGWSVQQKQRQRRNVTDTNDQLDLKAHIRGIPDFPKPGILFYDISTLLRHGPAWRTAMARRWGQAEILPTLSTSLDI